MPAWGFALLLSVLAAGCGSGGGSAGLGGSSSGGAVPGAPVGAVVPGPSSCAASVGNPLIPTVSSSDPVNGDQLVTTSTTGVANGGKSIAASFSVAMNPTTINTISFTLAPVGGTVVTASVTVNASATVATLTTTSALLPGTSYTAILTKAVTSAAGNPLACIYAWNFKTAVTAAAGAHPITLGLATPFALASAGGITNSGPTKINGDVVLDPNQTCNAVPVGAGNNFGACPANPPTNNAGDRVITQIFPDTTTADAVVADLNATFISIAPAALPGATVLGCGVIGSLGACPLISSSLPPGVYISATNSTIGVTGNLTLDAGGNANAVWVFQAPSTLTVNVGSTIILTGGAKASNVWWFVGSSATINTGVTMLGNILASAAISLGTLASSCGRLLSGASGAGALTMLSNTVSVPGHPNAPVGCL